MYTVKNHTAFTYFWNLASSCQKWMKMLKKKPHDEETIRKAIIDIECLEVLGKLAFGAKEFKEFRKDNPDVPNLP